MKKKKSMRMEESAEVNITPLMDVLTVLLFFLIMSASVAPVEMQAPDGIKLPTAQVDNPPKMAVKVALTAKALLVNDKVILNLSDGRFPASALERDQRIVTALKSELDQEFKKNQDFFKEVADAEAGLLATPPLLIQADKNTSFGTLKLILHTAALSGFGDFQFVVDASQ